MKTEKVCRCGVIRQPGYLYYLDAESRVARSKMVRPQRGKKKILAPEILGQTEIVRDPKYIYFLDDDGDISRVLRSTNGKPRPSKKVK